MTTEQAERLRGSRLDRWLRTITGSGWATVRPIAAVALSVGMVMSVVGVLPILGAAAPAPAGMFDQQFGAANSPGQTTDTRTGFDNLMPSPGSAEINPGGVDFATSQPPADAYLNGAYVQPSPAVEPQPGRSSDLPKALPGTGSGLGDLLLQVGLGVSVLALAVLALLYAARRRYYDPLLR